MILDKDENISKPASNAPLEEGNSLNNSTPSPLGEIAEAELFGDEVEQDVWKTPRETSVPLKAEVTFPALFSEAEVGVIVGLLKSRDENIRKLVSSTDGSITPRLTCAFYLKDTDVARKLGPLF